MGTIRRECLDYVIPLSEKHLRMILREWVAHLGPGVLGGLHHEYWLEEIAA